MNTFSHELKYYYPFPNIMNYQQPTYLLKKTNDRPHVICWYNKIPCQIYKDTLEPSPPIPTGHQRVDPALCPRLHPQSEWSLEGRPQTQAFLWDKKSTPVSMWLIRRAFPSISKRPFDFQKNVSSQGRRNENVWFQEPPRATFFPHQRTDGEE